MESRKKCKICNGEIAIESGGDFSSPQRQEGTHVAFPKDPHRHAVTRSFLDRSRTALVYHERTFCTLDIAPISSRFPARRDATRRDALCGLHDRDSRKCHAKSRRHDRIHDGNLRRVSYSPPRANNAKRVAIWATNFMWSRSR